MSNANSSLREMLESCANRGERIEAISHWLYSWQKEAVAGTPPPDWDVLRQAGCKVEDIEEMLGKGFIEVNYPSMPFRWLDPVERMGVIPYGPVAYDDAGWTTEFRKEAGDTGCGTLVGGFENPALDQYGNAYCPRLRPTKKLIAAGRDVDSCTLDSLRIAIRELGQDAAPNAVIKRAKIGRQKAIWGLRILEERNEYRGFTRGTPRRYAPNDPTAPSF